MLHGSSGEFTVEYIINNIQCQVEVKSLELNFYFEHFHYLNCKILRMFVKNNNLIKHHFKKKLQTLQKSFFGIA